MLRVSILATVALTSLASAQTVADIAARGACSTAGVEALSQQLAEAQMCLRPDGFVRFAPHAGITLSSSRVHPYLQASARDALQRAAARQPITVNSAFRTLADQYVLFHSGGCGLAARPGSSNHQSGRALDVASYATVRGALEAEGCVWLGSRDPVHFDCPGTDRRSDSILAFQRLWNANNPADTIAEDGSYGPQTESRLARAPVGGFANTGCGCTPGCDGDVIIGADCSRTECGGGLVCAGEGECVFEACAGIDGAICVDGVTLGTCAAGVLASTRGCPGACQGGAGSASCSTVSPDAGLPDAGVVIMDASVPDTGVLDAGVPDSGAPDSGGEAWLRPEVRTAVGSCSAGSGRGAGLGALLLLIFARRRNR